MDATAVDVRMLLAVGIVIAGSRLLGWALARVGQPRVIGEIVAGLVLVVAVVGKWGGAMLAAFTTLMATSTLSALGLAGLSQQAQDARGGPWIQVRDLISR